MGIDTESVLIVGWRISYDCLLQYLKEMGAGSCDDHQCLCGSDCCWAFDVEEGFEIVVTIPQYCWEDKDCEIFLTVKRAREEMAAKQMTAKKLVAILDDTEYMERAQKFAERLGAGPGSELQFFSKLHVT